MKKNLLPLWVVTKAVFTFLIIHKLQCMVKLNYSRVKVIHLTNSLLYTMKEI